LVHNRSARIAQFLLGFIIGKLIGAIVSTMPFFDLIFDLGVSDVFYLELVANI
jgi:hypothetical protein